MIIKFNQKITYITNQCVVCRKKTIFMQRKQLSYEFHKNVKLYDLWRQIQKKYKVPFVTFCEDCWGKLKDDNDIFPILQRYV